MKNSILKYIDYLYFPIFKRFIPLQTFRYAVCGGSNMVLDMIVYFLVFHFFVDKSDVNLGIIVVSPEIMSFLITFPIIFFTGFWLSKNISFQNSTVRTRVQYIRYIAVVGVNILVKYWGIKFCVDSLQLFPSISNAIMTIVTVVISYLLQKNYTFR